MPRLPRIEFAGLPQHVVQRGIDRQPCFLDVADYRRFLHGLREAALACECHVHAYVLMPDHVHLLVTPTTVGGVSRMMQQLGRGYVGYFNTRHHRSGTLWEGRFKSSLVDSDRYLLTCYCYIEMNPVRAALVASPGDYRWSSHASNASGQPDVVVSPHSLYIALGRDDIERRAAYRELLRLSMSEDDLSAIRKHVRQQRVLGTAHFQAAIEAIIGRCVHVRPRGRPPRQAQVEKGVRFIWDK